MYRGCLALLLASQRIVGPILTAWKKSKAASVIIAQQCLADFFISAVEELGPGGPTKA